MCVLCSERLICSCVCVVCGVLCIFDRSVTFEVCVCDRKNLYYFSVCACFFFFFFALVKWFAFVSIFVFVCLFVWLVSFNTQTFVIDGRWFAHSVFFLLEQKRNNFSLFLFIIFSLSIVLLTFNLHHCFSSCSFLYEYLRLACVHEHRCAGSAFCFSKDHST